MSSLRFKELPKEIQDLAISESIRLKAKAHIDPDCYVTEFFGWGNSNDGVPLWVEIANGNFVSFYKKYGKKEIKQFSIQLSLI